MTRREARLRDTTAELYTGGRAVPGGPGAGGIIRLSRELMQRETILILDFGSQYTQLIARRLRELQVYSEILPPGTRADSLAARHPRGIVLSGGPDSVHQRGAPRCDPRALRARRARARHLLRHAADEPRARRRGEALGPPRVRPGGLLAEAGGHALPRAAAAEPGLDEPRRRHPPRARRASRSSGPPRRTRSRPSRTPPAGSTGCSSTPRSSTRRRARRSSPTSSTPAGAAATGTRARSSRRRPTGSASRWGRRAG